MPPIDWHPDERPLFESRYRRWGRIFLLFTLVAIGGGVALALGRHEILGGLIASIGGTLGLIFGGAFWFTGRIAQRQLDALRDHAALARWRIDRDRWLTWHRARKASVAIAAAIVAGLLLVAGLVAAGLAYDDGDTKAASFLALGGALVAGLTYAALRLFAARPATPAGATVPLIIGPGGALTPGEYIQWHGFGIRFIDAAVEPSPPTLNVRFEMRNRYGTHTHTVPLPVPPDRLDEAHRVAQQLGPTQ